MKNVLLPTDFTVLSLRPIHDIVKDANGQKITIHVVHLINPPTSIADLLSIRNYKPHHLVPKNFIEAIQLMRNRYRGTVDSILFDFVYAGSQRFFNNVLEGINIDAIYVLDAYAYATPLNQSENILPYLTKCKVPVHKLQQPEHEISPYQNLSALFNQNEQVRSQPAKQVKNSVSYS